MFLIAYLPQGLPSFGTLYFKLGNVKSLGLVNQPIVMLRSINRVGNRKESGSNQYNEAVFMPLGSMHIVEYCLESEEINNVIGI